MADRSKALLWLLAAVVFSRFLTMYCMPFEDFTEPRYANIARMMAETGDWITPWFDYGTPFWAKPPLSFWLEAASFRLFGVSEFSARMPSWLATFASGYLVYLAAKLFSGQRTALWTALIFSSMSAIYIAGGAVMTDPFLLLGMTISIVSLLMVFDGRKRGWQWLFFFGLAIGLLAKGPITLVLIGGSAVLWLVWTRDWKTFFYSLPWFRGTLLMLLLAAPWYVAAELKTPGFLEYFILGEHFYRFVVPGWSGDLYGDAHIRRHGMIWLFWLIATLPWGLLLIAALLHRMIRAKSAAIVLQISAISAIDKWLICFALMPAAFFTFSGNILWTYLLPGLPPFALLTGKVLSGWLDQKSVLSISRLTLVLIVPVSISGIVLYASAQTNVIESERHLVNVYDKTTIENTGALYYVGILPFSARFYTGGKAGRLNLEQAFNKIKQPENYFYLAIRDDQLDEFISHCTSNCEKLATDMRYTLFSISPLNDTDKSINP
jgi:4-amino-4-deoxy-L-arabinose transferase-like glycosyltransferase